jgi:Phage terminase large subunit gpA, ATPase domain
LLSTLSHSLRGHADDARPAAPSLLLDLGRHRASGPTNALEWASLHRKLEGRPFSLDHHRPLRAIYADPHEHIAIIKPAQRGVSEYAINLTGFALDRGPLVWTDGAKDGLNVAYIFPKKEALGDFSKERLSGMARESPYLSQLFGGGDDAFNAVTFKQVRESFLYLRGGWSTSALKSFPADVLILDEFDEMAGSAVALARRRLNASLVRREVDISTPSVPGFGIHRMFLDSDQHRYLQRHRCGRWVVYDFLRDVRVRGASHDAWGEWPAEEIRRHPVTLHCPECGERVTDAERLSEGRWEAQAPEVQGLRGYWVPPLAFPSVNLLRLAAAAVNPDPFERQQFFQSDLGLPYTVAGAKITLEQILQLSSPLENGQLPAGRWLDPTMGVDVGFKKHWKVSATAAADGRRYTLAVGAVDEWADLDGLMRHFRIRRCIVDAQPDLDSAKEFAARWPGRVLRAFYPGPSALKGQLWHMDGLDLKKLRNRRLLGRLRTDVITINRTMAMDRVRAMIVKLAEPAPVAVTNDPELQAHLESPTRTTRPDTRGQPVSVWLHSGPDHLFHAMVYDAVARETLPSGPTTFAAAVAGGQAQLGAPQTTAPPQPSPSAGLSRRQQVRSVIERAASGAIARQYGDPDRPLRRRSRREQLI